MDAEEPDDKSFEDILERALDKGATLPASDRLHPISMQPGPDQPPQRIVPLMAKGAKGGELAGIHVLIVDDDPVALEMMEAALHYVGALVTSVPSAKKALEVISRVTPDVIVSDMRMPEKDGVTFARELQAKPAYRAIPILAVTAYDEIYIRGDLRAAGIMGFLRKPITFTELVHAVAALAFVGGSG
ncbi:MAG TPA: response regulator [Methylomirabilota bacterium]|jgi:CheY-like chemotaxis protein